MELTAAHAALLVAMLLVAGITAGLLAGLLGVGGGIVLVPVLYHGFSELGVDPSVRTHVAVATSLATVAVTTFRSVRLHHRRGAVDTALLRSWGPAAAAGSLLGTVVTAALGGRVLAGVFGSIALLVAAWMAFGRESWRLAAAPPAGPGRFVLAGAIGFVSVMMGLGGGTLGVPTLTLLGVAIHRAVGTATGLGFAIGVPGAIGLAWAGLGVPGRPPGCIGYVNAVGFALIVPATWLAAPFGARWAHAISRLALRRAFAAFLAVSAIRMLADLG
jgi:uncharacterized membrane protein YfcA